MEQNREQTRQKQKKVKLTQLKVNKFFKDGLFISFFLLSVCFLSKAQQSTHNKLFITKWILQKDIDWEADFQGRREFKSICKAVRVEGSHVEKIMKLINTAKVFKGKIGAGVYKKYSVEIKDYKSDVKFVVLTDGICLYSKKKLRPCKKLVKLLKKLFSKEENINCID